MSPSSEVSFHCSVWLSSAEEPLTPTILVYHDQNNAAVVDMPNTGPAGDSAALYDQLVGGNGIIPEDSTYPLDIQAEMSLHESIFAL